MVFQKRLRSSNYKNPDWKEENTFSFLAPSALIWTQRLRDIHDMYTKPRTTTRRPGGRQEGWCASLHHVHTAYSR